MAKFALVKDGLVVNTIEWNGEECDFGEGVEAIEYSDGTQVSPGWSYDGKGFNAPPLTDKEIASQKEEKITNNISLKASLIAQATIAIAPLQDAIDLDDATDAETAALKSWKQYRVAVNRVDANTADDIAWPEQPL